MINPRVLAEFGLESDPDGGIVYDDGRFSGGPGLRDFGGDPLSDQTTVKQVQTALNAQKYGPLTVDGDHGPKTAAAIKAFQVAKGLTATGNIDDETLTALSISLPAGTSITPAVPPADKQVAAAITAAAAKGAVVPPHVATAASHGILVSAKGIGGHIKSWWTAFKAKL